MDYLILQNKLTQTWISLFSNCRNIAADIAKGFIVFIRAKTTIYLLLELAYPDVSSNKIVTK